MDFQVRNYSKCWWNAHKSLIDLPLTFVYFSGHSLWKWAEYFGVDCITSCNKVENCLFSEYDPDYAMHVDRKSRRWSAARPHLAHATGSIAGFIACWGTSTAPPPPPGGSSSSSTIGGATALAQRVQKSLLREIPSFRTPPSRSSRLPPPGRSIPVIYEAEASV